MTETGARNRRKPTSRVSGLVQTGQGRRNSREPITADGRSKTTVHRLLRRAGRNGGNSGAKLARNGGAAPRGVDFPCGLHSCFNPRRRY